MTPAEKLAKTCGRKQSRASRERETGNVTWACRARELRHRVGLTLHAVADALGVHHSTVAAVEQGRDPVLSTARKLADFYGKSVEELWTELVGEKTK